MEHDLVIWWLERKLKSQAVLAVALGVLALVGGTAILALTWGLMYAVCLYCLEWILGFSHWSYTLIPTVMIPLLFWGNARATQEYLSEYSVTTGTASDKVVVFYLPRIGVASNVNPLAPDTLHTMVKMITDCLYFGPRVVTSALCMFVKAFRLGRVDVPSSAAVITVLADAGQRMSFQDITDSIEGLNPAATFPQLRNVDGVLFLESEPAGLALGTTLKAELARSSQPAQLDAYAERPPKTASLRRWFGAALVRITEGDLNRSLSGIVCIICFMLAHSLLPDGGIWLLLRWIVWPMALIWFSEALGSMKGVSALHPVNAATPERVVRFVGWMFLLLILGYLLYRWVG